MVNIVSKDKEKSLIPTIVYNNNNGIFYSIESESQSNDSLNYRTITKKEPLTTYGIWLDNEDNKTNFENTINNLFKYTVDKTDYSLKNGCLTDCNNHWYFLLGFENLPDSDNVTTIDSPANWVISIIEKLGYLNDEPEMKDEDEEIKFNLILKETSDSIPFILFPVLKKDTNKNPHFLSQ